MVNQPFTFQGTTSFDTILPKVAMDKVGDYVEVWQTYHFLPFNKTITQIYGRRYNAAGVAQGNQFEVSPSTTVPVALIHQFAPSVAMDAAGDFVVTWETGSQYLVNEMGVYARRYNAAGISQGSEFQVNNVTTNSGHKPSVAMDVAGDFVVSWLSYDQSGMEQVYARKYLSTGLAQGGEFRVNAYTVRGLVAPSVAMDAVGNFVVVYGHGVNGEGPGVYAQRYNSAAVAQGVNFAASSATTVSNYSPTVAMDAAGDFVVSYQRVSHNPDTDGVYARRFNSSGVAKGDDFRANTVVGAENASITMDKAGNFVIAWDGGISSHATNVDIFARQYNSAGTAVGAPFLVNTHTANNQQYASVAMNSPGNFVIAWQSQLQNAGLTGIYSQRFSNVNHAPMGTTGTVTTLLNTAYQFKTSDFGFTDPNDSPSNSLLAVKFTLLSSIGSLKDNGVGVTANQLVSAADIANGKLIFTPSKNLTGGPFTLCKFQVEDNGGTAGGGMNLDPLPKIISIKIKV